MQEYEAVMNPATFEYPTSSSSVSGTSELFSSTFAILSDSAPSYAEPQWVTPEKLPGYYYESQPTEFTQLQAYDGGMDLRFDAYRTAATAAAAGLHGYDHYNLPSLPVVAPQLNVASYLDHSLLRQPEPLHVYTHQSQAGTAFQPVSSHSVNTLPIVPSPATSISQRPTSSTSNNSVTPPHHNNNNQSTPPQSESPPDTIPLQATELDDDERVMCMACRGVYPSRRSLTGHIGRNEKCREIIGFTPHQCHVPPPPSTQAGGGQPPPPQQPLILSIPQERVHQNGNLSSSLSSGSHPGRNYLEQLATAGNGEGRASAVIPPPPGTESAKAGAIVNGTDGLSPICPYCDRFISHYKGNIRRHINQCGKTGGKRPKAPKGKDGKRKRSEESTNGEWSSPEPIHMQHSSHPGYDAPMPPMPPVMSPPSMLLSSVPPQGMEMVQPPPLMNPSIIAQSQPSHHSLHSLEVKTSISAPPLVPGPKKESEIPDDPYLCPFCDFLTVYKGNMKRHMNTCHVNEPDCKDYKLDKMKASVLGVDPATLMEKINAHKANSTRGRRPKKKEGQSGESRTSESQARQHTHQQPPISTHLEQFQHHHMYQMNNPFMGMHHVRMGGMLEYDEMGCPADPYVYPIGLITRPLPGLGEDPSDPLQATINHVVDTHRL